MTLATFADANVHLDGKKIEFLNAEDAAGEATAADRWIRGRLSDIFTAATVSAWDSSGTPAATPEIVREAAALLMAHYRYARTYSEETQAPNSYAARLYNQAMEIVTGLTDGTLALVDYPTVVSVVDQPSFFPDDQYVDLVTMEPIRFATMEEKF